MTLKKNDLIYFFLICILAIIGVVFNQDYFSLLLVFFIYLFVGMIVESKSSLHMMFFLGFSTFIFLPSILNWYYLDVDFSLYFLSSIVSAFFIILTKETKVKLFVDYGKMPKVIFCAFCLVSIFFISIGLGRFVTPMFAVLIVLLSLCFKQNNIKNNFLYLIIFFLVFTAYSLFFWNGFGRTVVVGWLLLASLQFTYSVDFKVNKYLFGLLPGLGSTLLSDRNILQLRFSGFEQSLYDSAYQPYRLASTFVDYSNRNGIDIEGFWDQIVFTFFVFIPRSIWPDKPYGFGFEYTVQNLDDYLVDVGHSIAATLIGEHLYYLGYLGILTSMIVFFIIALATNFLYRIKSLNGNGVLIFSSSMMVLVWGGMSSFSARIALASMVFMLVLFTIKGILNTKIRTVWGK